jgi:fatty acid desaturase
MQAIARKFWQVEGPTWILAVAIYGVWFLLMWFQAYIPWWAMIFLGGYVIAWQFSLQHETIHGFRGVPKWFRTLIAMPPLGLWFPYPMYRRSHSLHHRNTYLTVPGQDTETYYVKQAEWAAMNKLERAILLFNQTLVGRLLIGPLIRLYKLGQREIGRIRNRDYINVPHWALHVVLVGLLFWFVSGVCGMPWWQYILLVAYPGFSLGLLRAFIEHRAGPRPGRRVASVESNTLFGLLFLYNNLHVAHHLRPAIPWYELPRFYRENRAKLMKHNDNFVFRGYWGIAREYMFKPVFIPVHPTV